MKLKLTHSEFKVLHDLLTDVVNKPRPTGIEQVAVYGLLRSLWKSFYKRAIEHKKQYSVPITDEQACAFYMYFSRVQRMDIYTANLISQICSKIHQQFS